MNKRELLKSGAGALALASFGPLARAQQDTLKIGLIVPMTGAFATTGLQVDAAVKLYMQEHGNTVAGKKVEILLKDDANVADTTRRLAQELVVNDKVVALAGFGLTPLAFAAAPVATQTKTAMLVMCAATSSVTERSPFIVRSSFTLPQVTLGVAEWSAKNKIKSVVTLVADYGPGIDAEKTFKQIFTSHGGQILAELRVPQTTPDFAPFLQRVLDAKPEAVFVFVPTGVGASFMKQFTQRGLAKAGIRVVATGDVIDDMDLGGGAIGDEALGVITSHVYSAAHPSEMNRKFVAGFKKIANMRPTHFGVAPYDGMHMLYEGLKKTNGQGGQALVDAMKGMTFESPRGMMTIDPETRDPIQDVYIRKVERVNGELWNVEFDKIPQVRDPGKVKKS